MGKIRRVLRCYSCGALLQSNNKKKPGYISAEVLEQKGANDMVLYCDKCYDAIKAFNNSLIEKSEDEDALKILDYAKESKALILWIIDLFSFTGALNKDIVKKVKGLDIIVVATKKDLFPSSFRGAAFEAFIKENFEAAGLKPLKIFTLGNTDKMTFGEQDDIIHKARNGKDVFVIGDNNSGKSTLINRFLKFYKNPTKRAVAYTYHPGCDKRILEIPLDKDANMIEVPGFSLVNSTVSKVEKEMAKLITPKKTIKRTSRVIAPGQGVSIGSLGAFELISGKNTTFHVYTSEMSETHNIIEGKLDEYLKFNVLTKIVRPFSDRFSQFVDFDVFEYVMENDGEYHDIAITGLGWLSFHARGQVIRVTCPKGVELKESVGKIRNYVKPESKKAA